MAFGSQAGKGSLLLQVSSTFLEAWECC